MVNGARRWVPERGGGTRMGRPWKAFRPLMAAGLALVGLGAAVAQVTPGRRPAPEPRARTYGGASPRGNFQEALNDAVAQAMRAQPGADRLVRYRLREVTGEQGGIAGINLIRVTIELTEDSGGQPARPEPTEEASSSETLRQAVR